MALELLNTWDRNESEQRRNICVCVSMNDDDKNNHNDDNNSSNYERTAKNG